MKLELAPHKYRDMSPEAQDELFSNYLIESWSYSKVTTFSRNEKAFEMSYLFGVPYSSSPAAVAGSAYHSALQSYFENFKDGVLLDIVDLQLVAHQHIDGFDAMGWKLQAKNPTVAESVEVATKVVNAGLLNFLENISVYIDQIKEILHVELYLDQFISVNGVSIPLPCHGLIDLVFINMEDKRIITDHKLKNIFTSDKVLKFQIGKQAITYVHLYETKFGESIDEVWFVENKYSKNKNQNIPQLSCFKVILDKNTRALYDSLLYDNLKRMIDAVADPDYVFLINDADNFVDMAEIYEFWAQMQITEVEDWNVVDSKKDLIRERMKKIKDVSIKSVDPKTIRKFRDGAAKFIQYDVSMKDLTHEEKIATTLRNQGIKVDVAHTFDGYSSDTYLLNLSAEVPIKSVFKYKLDIARALGAANVRMMNDLFVHEGQSYVSVEASKKRTKDLVWDKKYLVDYMLPLGIDNFGRVQSWDLKNPSMPHMLMCGQTGSGKTVSISSLIYFALEAGIKQIDIFDPKYTYTEFAKLPGVKVYQEIEDIEKRAMELVAQMKQRVKTGVDKITMLFFDEFGEAYLTAKSGRQLDIEDMVVVGEHAPKKGDLGVPQPKLALKKIGELKSLQQNIGSLLQMGRSSGYRLCLGTQRASAKLISGDFKVNLPIQVCYAVPREADSRVVIDESGAENLAGEGDGLFRTPSGETIRFQSFFRG